MSKNLVIHNIEFYHEFSLATGFIAKDRIAKDQSNIPQWLLENLMGHMERLAGTRDADCGLTLNWKAISNIHEYLGNGLYEVVVSLEFRPDLKLGTIQPTKSH